MSIVRRIQKHTGSIEDLPQEPPDSAFVIIIIVPALVVLSCVLRLVVGVPG